MLIGVTGGCGRIGQAVIDDLGRHGHKCRSIDIGRIHESTDRFRRADLRELWQTMDALEGLDAIIHLAGIGAPDRSATAYPLLAEQTTFVSNVTATYNVFAAARALGIDRVVWASSETVAGFPFDVAPPDFLPVTEDHPARPEYSYALAKAGGEDIARHFAADARLSAVSLRFSVVFDELAYNDLPLFWADPRRGKWNLWSYVDIRDVATSCRLATESGQEGAEAFVVAAPDTLMDRPTAELLDEFAPDTASLVREPLSRYQSLQSTDRIATALGFRPERSWRTRSAHA